MSFSRVVRAALSLALLLSVSVAAGAAVFVSSGDTVWRMDDGLTAIEAAQSGFTGVAALAAQPIGSVLIGSAGSLQRWDANLTGVLGIARGYGGHAGWQLRHCQRLHGHGIPHGLWHNHVSLDRRLWRSLGG